MRKLNTKLHITKEGLLFFLTQALLLGCTIGIWSFFSSSLLKEPQWSRAMIAIMTGILLFIWFVFLINNYLLVPRLYFARQHTKPKRWLFWLINCVIIVFPALPILPNDGWANYVPAPVQVGLYNSYIIWIVVNYAMVGLAIGRQYYLRQKALQRQLAEEKQRSTEAELSWLKNQLNPHFLFNTLNNISSLTQIDADEAQDAIGRLSDLLRYALYETRTEQVSIGGEMEFMQNYIALMSLRCGPNVEVTTDFRVGNPSLTVAPMLLLSPIENAFKHGVSSSKPSFIRLSLHDGDGALHFSCENSNYPKPQADRSGSGIGIENMKKRLELIYPGRYTLDYGLSGDTYHVNITIK